MALPRVEDKVSINYIRLHNDNDLYREYGALLIADGEQTHYSGKGQTKQAARDDLVGWLREDERRFASGKRSPFGIDYEKAADYLEALGEVDHAE